MINPVSNAGFPDAFASPQAQKPETPETPPPAAAPSEAKPAPEHDVRLTIDHAPDGPNFVYTLRDRSTGRILAQLPREAASDLGQSPGYHAGQLVRAKA